jgi:hypothetical protein
MDTNQDKLNDQTLWRQLAIPTGDILLEVLLEIKAEQEAIQQEKEKEPTNASITRPCP